MTAMKTLLCLYCLCLTLHLAGAEWIQADASITYKQVDGHALKLHLFFPDGSAPKQEKPAIVFFHGGGWQRGHTYSHFPHAQHLKDRGMISVVAEYRLKDTHGNQPIDCLKDAKSAMRYVRSHAKELSIQADKIAAAGASAGGQLAFMCTKNDGINDSNDDLRISSAPNALWLHIPVLNTGPEGFSHNWVKKYWQTFSPHHNINEETPATLINIGDKDPVTPLPIAQKFVAAMHAAKRSCQLRIYPGGAHNVLQRNKFPRNFYDALIAGDDFLHQQGFLAEPLSREQRGWLRVQGGATLIDVRSKAEYDEGHFENALFIPHTEIAARIAQTNLQKDDHIILYCKSGGRSGMAEKTLHELGYTHAFNAGGYVDLKKAKPIAYK